MPRPLSELSDTELQSIASGAPPLEHFSDEQLGALAVHQGLMQDEEAATAITEKKQRDRAPVAAAVAGTMAQISPVPAIVTETLLTRGGRVGDIAAEALAPIAGAIAGAPGGIPGIVAGGASGGAAGNTLAQARQFFRGERDNFAKGELTASAIAGGIPLGGRLLKTPARVIATRAAQGAGIAVGSQAVGQAIDHGRLDFQSLALTGMFGGLFGAGAGAVESALTRKAVLKAIRGTPEFEQFKGTDAELVDAVRTKMNENAPPPAAAPAARNVTGTAAPEAPAAPVKPLAQLTNTELVQAAEATAPTPSAPAQVTPLPMAPNVAAVNVPAGGSPLPPAAPIPDGAKAEPTFSDLLYGRVDAPEVDFYMRQRMEGATQRWAALSPDERNAVHAELGTTNPVMIDKGTLPYDATPSRFNAVVDAIEAARKPAPVEAAPAAEAPLEQQIAEAELAASRAASRFRDAGKWSELKGQSARQRWQSLKGENETAQRKLEDLRRQQPAAPAAEIPAAPVKPLAELTDAELQQAAQDSAPNVVPAEAPSAPAPAARQPWEMTRREWETEREAIRPETFGSSPNKASASREAGRIQRLTELLGGVSDEASAKLKAASKGEITLTPEELERYQDRISSRVQHRDVVAKAIAEGRPVPAEVLAEYPGLAPVERMVPPPAAEPAPVVDEWLKVDVPEAGLAEENTRVNQRKMDELNAEIKTALEAVKQWEAKLIKRTGPMYERGRIKKAAKASEVTAYRKAQAEVDRIRRNQTALQEVGRQDAKNVRLAELARGVNDAASPLIRRLALRLELYDRQNPNPGPEADRLIQAFDAAASAEIRTRVPDATPEEIRKLSIALQGAASDRGGDLESAWRLNPGLQVAPLRRAELGAALNAEQFPRWKESAPELAAEVNRYIDEFKNSSERWKKSEAQPLTRAGMAELLKRVGVERQRIEGERMAIERMQQKRAEENARRAGITKVVSAAGVKITPTPPVERRVSSLADRPQLRAQREFLEKALRDAAAVAPTEKDISPEFKADYDALQVHQANWRKGKDVANAMKAIRQIAVKYLENLPETKGEDATDRLASAVIFNLQGRISADVPAVLVVEVPGDGTFRVANWRDSILELAETVRKEFGRGISAPVISTPPTRGRSLPAAGSLGTPEQINKALAEQLHDDRNSPLSQILQDGPWTIAGGRTHMWFVQGGKGKTRADLGDKFPPIAAMLAREAPELTLIDSQGRPRAQLGAALHKLTIDVTEQLKKLNSAMAALEEGGKKDRVQFHVEDGQLGLSYSSVVAGTEYKSDGVRDGAASVATVSPYVWRDILEGMRRLGAEKAEVVIPRAKDPKMAPTLALRAGDRIAAVFKAISPEFNESAPSFNEAPAAAPVKKTSGAAGSMGRAGDAPPPADSHFPPSDDPTFSQLPLQLPEMVQFFKQISGGQTPKIMEKIRILHGSALGVFRYQEGVLGSGRVELRADLFNLLGVRQKNQLLEEAVAWATTMKQANPEMNFAEAVKRRFHEAVKAAEAKALTEDPRRALDTFAHEIGHFVDFLPHGTITRGNILGRLASLHHYLKGWIGENPSITAVAPNSNERAKLRRQAEKELTASVKEIVETITREVPVYREIPITAEHITSILKTAQREEFPDLYDWFSKLDRAEKVAVLRQAMKGIVDERAARLAAREQIGTKIVEETVTRRTGTEPTPEAIRARYDELLREEFKRRGLISQKEIRAELETVIAWWQGVPVIPEYYKSPEELYAEMFSILLNNPAALAKRAPTVWKSLFAYFDRKPEVKAAYDKVQSDIKSGAIYAQRVANLRDAFRADEESGLLKDIAGSRLDWRKIRDTMRLLFDRQHGPIEARALRRLGSPESARVLSALKDYLYRMTAVEGYARELNQQVEGKLAAAGLRHDDLAEFMFHSRIAAGDRQQIANAQGWSPNTSAARLKEMAADLGAARYGALEAAQQANRAIYETRVVDLLARADVLTPELLGLIRDRTLYATFAKTREFNPLEHGTIEGLLESSYGKDVTAKIFRQIGYLGDIRSPYLAMTQKAFALINFAYKQMALKSVVDFMLEHEPSLIAAAEVKFNGKLWEPRIVDTAKVGTLITIVKGEVKAFYVPREIAETMQHGSPLEGMIVGLAHRVLAWPKALLTELNAGFWPVAFAKDLAMLGLQLPGGHRALRHVPAAFGAARASFTGKANPLADAALRRLMVISRADPRGEHLGHPDEMTRLLLRMGQDPALWDAEAAKVSRVMRAWMWWKRQGATLERTAKIAGMMHLDGEEFAATPEWMKKRMVNELAGSPDFLERGRAAPIVEAAGGSIFYNAWLQGMRSFKRAAQQNPKEFWTKFLAAFGLPALAFYAFEKGLLDFGMDKAEAEDHRDQLRSIPERDKLRGFVIPLGWQDKAQGKVAYLVLPFPDQVRYLVAGLRKTAQTAGNDGAAKDLGAGSMVQFGGQDLPGQNPLISEGVKWWRYAALGQNPYDAFHAKPALDPDVFKAGGLTAAGDLAKQSLSNLGGGLVYKYRHTAPGETPTEAEKFLGLPVVSNVLGRWVRVSNAGLTEEANRATAPVQQHEAAMRLVGEEMARKTIAGEPWAPSEQKLIENDPYLAGYVPEKLGRVMKHATGPEMRAFEQATSPMQKAALLQQWERRDKERKTRLETP